MEHARNRPVVAVLCCGGGAPGRGQQFVADRYLHALARAGCAAVLVPAMSAVVDAVAVAARCDALLMTGSVSNVSPARYGGACAAVDPDLDRDEVALAVAGEMISAGRPLLGICRGMQELNVLHGGSLAVLEDHDGLHMGGSDWDCPSVFDHAHEVRLVEGRLAELAGSRGVTVASIHRQGVDRLGSGLSVEGVAPDGLVEAFSAERGRVVGVQWHPELLRSRLDLALFEDLARAA